MRKPRSKSRKALAARQEARRSEISRQVTEHQQRSLTKKGKLKAGYALSKKFSRAKPGAFESKITGAVEKRVYRFKGIDSIDLAAEVLLELRDDRPRWAAYAQIGEGYKNGAIWVGSKVSTPQQASIWLQGIGVNYMKKDGPFGGRPIENLWVEVVALRKVEGKKTWGASNEAKILGSKAEERYFQPKKKKKVKAKKRKGRSK